MSVCAETRGRELLGAFRVGNRWAFYAREARRYHWVTRHQIALLADLLDSYDDDEGSRCRAYLLWRQYNGRPVSRASMPRLEKVAP